jgi:hypothetical protein
MRLIVQGREAIRLQLAHNCDDVVGCDQRQAAAAQPGQEVALQLRAVEDRVFDRAAHPL